MNFFRRMIKRFVVDSDFDQQMARLQDEHDRLVLQRRDELQMIYRELEGVRDELTEPPTTVAEHKAVLQ